MSRSGGRLQGLGRRRPLQDFPKPRLPPLEPDAPKETGLGFVLRAKMSPRPMWNRVLHHECLQCCAIVRRKRGRVRIDQFSMATVLRHPPIGWVQGNRVKPRTARRGLSGPTDGASLLAPKETLTSVSFGTDLILQRPFGAPHGEVDGCCRAPLTIEEFAPNISPTPIALAVALAGRGPNSSITHRLSRPVRA